MARVKVTSNDIINVNAIPNKAIALYVVNATSNAKGNYGNVVFSVDNANGGSTGVLVPKTWIPIDLLEQVRIDQLLGSNEFRRAVSNGLLAIITEDCAKRLRMNTGAEAEIARIQEDYKDINLIAQSSAFTLQDDADESEFSNINMRIRTILSGEPDPIYVMNQVQSLDGDLTIEDLDYIRQRAKELGKDNPDKDNRKIWNKVFKLCGVMKEEQDF